MRKIGKIRKIGKNRKIEKSGRPWGPQIFPNTY